MKLLIVDDDIYTREGLAETIPWNLYGIDDVCHAGGEWKRGIAYCVLVSAGSDHYGYPDAAEKRH